jgi:Family of unknown function (DUF6356)
LDAQETFVMEARLPSFPVVSATPRGLLDRIFLEHPRSLGESYWSHQRRAFGFGITMVVAGLACVIHAVFPAVFERTASSTVTRLHGRMKAAQRLGA